MAIKLANQKRRPKLAEMLVNLARQKNEEEEEEEESDDELNEVVENGFNSQTSRQSSISQQFHRFVNRHNLIKLVLIAKHASILTPRHATAKTYSSHRPI